jgi:hypothetical protein
MPFGGLWEDINESTTMLNFCPFAFWCMHPYSQLNYAQRLNCCTCSCRCGKLVLVDLAGSERLKETGNAGKDALRETGHINKSLFTLGQVSLAWCVAVKHPVCGEIAPDGLPI